MTKTYIIRDIREWDTCLADLREVLRPGMILALSGPLGAGKTTFTQELVQQYGGSAMAKSPTFALLRTYSLNSSSFSRLLHIDAYRLERPEDAQVLALDEELDVPGTIAVIEWPEHMADWLLSFAERVVWLTIVPQEDGTRSATLECRT